MVGLGLNLFRYLLRRFWRSRCRFSLISRKIVVGCTRTLCSAGFSVKVVIIVVALWHHCLYQFGQCLQSIYVLQNALRLSSSNSSSRCLSVVDCIGATARGIGETGCAASFIMFCIVAAFGGSMSSR